MFANQRGSSGLGSVATLGLVLVGWLVVSGLFVKAYREGGALKFTEGGTCQLVCQSAKAKS